MGDRERNLLTKPSGKFILVFMKRNELIKAVGERIHEQRMAIARLPFNSPLEARMNGRLGELERFCNDLCNVPCDHNRNMGAGCYTMKEAIRKWRAINAT